VSVVDGIANAIRKLYGVESKYAESVPVKEVFQGRTVWEGVVEVYDLIGHPKAAQCYAWRYQDDENQAHYTAVLRLPPVNSPQDAVKAAIVAQVKDANQKT
jgi:hypothetical protein